jgi:hypothetical protein
MKKKVTSNTEETDRIQILYNLRIFFLGFLGQVRDSNSGSKDCIVRMFGGKICGCLGC